ncbi:MAG: glycosyltransferase [Bacteroidaceae bacterium]|nr:glycosyltransferase [Bacteroidaceae bacterium]
MKVLWFTNSPSNYKRGANKYNGGGWISSLETSFMDKEDIDLAIAFTMDGQEFKVRQNRVTYYPMPCRQMKKWRKIQSLFYGNTRNEKENWPKLIQQYQKVIEDFKPDVIQVFGSEQPFGLIASETNIPVVLHIQGILNPYLNAFLPPFISLKDYYWQSLNPINALKNYNRICLWQRNCFREREIFKRVKYYIGRTEWDRMIVEAYTLRQSKYYYGSEILRAAFYKDEIRDIPQKLTISTTISNPTYKGFDFILKTADFLKNEMGLEFDWKVYGNINPRFMEKKFRIKTSEVNIHLKGVASAEEIKESLLRSTVYVHPSYIDNSPNSICEAQLQGIPVIACNVGGVSSLIEHEKTGILVPANDPTLAASHIYSLYSDRNKNIRLGQKAKEIASARHNRGRIVNGLMNTYLQILKKD